MMLSNRTQTLYADALEVVRRDKRVTDSDNVAAAMLVLADAIASKNLPDSGDMSKVAFALSDIASAIR